MGFRITTWNVNGIRNPFSYEPWRGTRTFESMFDILEADIVVFQETKIQRKDLRDDMVLVPGWDCYFSLPRVKKGYSGVVIYTRNETCAPIRAEEGITGILCPPNSTTPFRELSKDQQIGGYPTMEQLSRPSPGSDYSDSEKDDDGDQRTDTPIDPVTLDSEGRSVLLEFPAFVLIGVYCPANRDQSRDNFRIGFLNALDARIRNLVALGKQVFVTGDINIAKKAIDSAHALEAIRRKTQTEETYISGPSRRLFNQLLSDGAVVGPRESGREHPVLHDICRAFHPSRTGMYTCWDTRLNTRPGNFGARIDYVLCSLDMQTWFSDSNIQEGLMGSDHCPVYAIFKDQIPHGAGISHIRDLMNPVGTFREGERQQEYSSQSILPASGRRLPEFDVDKRRSIKDMFARKSTSNPTQPPFAQSTPPATCVAPGVTATSSVSSATNEASSNSSSPIQNHSLNQLPRKRPQPLSSIPSKRPKSAMTPSSATTGQKTLKGFFKAKTVERDAFSQPPTETSSSSDKSGTAALASSNMVTHALENTAGESTATAETPFPLFDSNNIIDPIVSKEDWSKLFTKKPAPRCDGHQEPCMSLTTKKPGMNRGRAFWICSRPLGPSGEKEKGSQWRCPTFMWASDWNPTAQGNS
ncbi:hypothetical protein N7462_001585 [Penicillium macrosclerotiorum]|uniref:uncharacterized protein n=1 Tax=Penicillium macrosclerotiorum TaxID=303699 RepID=UPI002546DEF9|nr:uncharacterized protein N7462_001585 [Penicillium macrosclerotiorum]KAJ5692162.1 hypothetical protein N7462_001585 [Penicillium macrosclerotiorum]